MGLFRKKRGTYTLTCLGSVMVALGIIVASVWEVFFDKMLENKMVLTNSSIIYKFWKEPTTPAYTYAYLFNWTNAEEVIQRKWAIKPKFQECGPYVFSVQLVHVNITWNKNDTVTFHEKIIWKFSPTRSKGSLNDKITTLNPVATVLASKVKNKSTVIKKGVEWILDRFERNLVITKTANELLFEGYDDEILKLLSKLPYLKKRLDGKFGWFHFVNDSVSLAGTLTMYTGKSNLDLLGKMNTWNGNLYTNSYKGHCALVNGTTGELFSPIKNYEKISVFNHDICSSLTFHYQKDASVNGVTGKKFIGTDYIFDNGSKYPEQACFLEDRQLPSGTRDISECRFGAPAFISFPHFYLADSSYRQKIDGMMPNGTKHESELILEPNTGIPLLGRLQLQVNLFVEEIPSIKMFSDVKPTFIPIFWINQVAALPETYSHMLKVLLVIRNMGLYIGVASFCTGVALAAVGFYLFFKNRHKDEENEQLVKEET